MSLSEFLMIQILKETHLHRYEQRSALNFGRGKRARQSFSSRPTKHNVGPDNNENENEECELTRRLPVPLRHQNTLGLRKALCKHLGDATSVTSCQRLGERNPEICCIAKRL